YAASAPAQSPAAPAAASATSSVCPRRIFLPTADTRLIALNADTGKMCEDFGNKGSVDLTANMGTFAPGGYYSTSPPAVTKDLV
ncbi:glucose dehydrogenase, partial [Pseudomonas syringae pv. actinidiae ICMP 19070]